MDDIRTSSASKCGTVASRAGTNKPHDASNAHAAADRNTVLFPAFVYPTKETTGIVGLDVLDDPKARYQAVCEDVLREVARGIPEDAGYRKIVEEVYEERLAKTRAGANAEEIESAIGEGQIEELYEIAKDELGLIPKMREWKPWEFDHEIEMIEEPKENPYFAEAARED